MSDLLNSDEGRNVVLEAQRFQLRKRLSRFFERNLVIDYEQWSKGLAEFDLATLLGDLNVAWDDELRDLYRLLGTIGGLDESIADTQIYINATTGSDITGTGSATRPYASLWFLDFLPKTICHAYIILISSDVAHAGSELDLCFSFRGEGCLSFVGVGAMEDPYGGALDSTVTVNTLFNNVWRETTANIAPLAACQKLFMLMTSGASNGHATPVCRVDVANSRIYERNYPVVGIVVNDTFRYVRPQHTLSIFGGTIAPRCAADIHEDVNGSARTRASRINFVNLNIDLNDLGIANGSRRKLVVEGDPVGFWGVRILVPDAAESFDDDVDIVFRTEVNHWNPRTDRTVLAGYANSGVDNMFLDDDAYPNAAGLMFINRDAGTDSIPYDDLVLALEHNARLRCVDCMAGVQTLNANVRTESCSFKQLTVFMSTQEIENCCCDPSDAAALYCMSFECSQAKWLDSLIGTSTGGHGIRVWSSHLKMEGSGGDTAGTITSFVYAVNVEGLSNVYMVGPWIGTSGFVAPNDLEFTDPAVPVTSAFPAANATVNDALGNNCTRG